MMGRSSWSFLFCNSSGCLVLPKQLLSTFITQQQLKYILFYRLSCNSVVIIFFWTAVHDIIVSALISNICRGLLLSLYDMRINSSFITSYLFSVGPLLCCGVCFLSLLFKCRDDIEVKKSSSLSVAVVEWAFCSSHADLNSRLTGGFLLFLFSVFLSLNSPLMMEESCSKGAYLNLGLADLLYFLSRHSVCTFIRLHFFLYSPISEFSFCWDFL